MKLFSNIFSELSGFKSILECLDKKISPVSVTGLSHIHRACLVSALVGNILLLSKVDNKAIQPNIKKYRLDEQIRQSVLTFEREWDEKDIELDIDLEETEFIGNENLMFHVWNNLISNAIKFTPDGGKIDITLKRKDKSVEIKVADTGCGMTSEVGAKIFEKFYQGDTSHSTQGNGLGLALVKKVIDILGGEISVRSEVNKGSTFTILLKDVVYED